MKSVSCVKQWLGLLLVIIIAAGVLIQAADAAEPTGRCTNLVNEGVEYFSNITVMGSDVTKWRQDVDVYAYVQGTTDVAGEVLGMDIEVTNDTNRYNCTIITPYDKSTGKTKMSCNSIPVNAIINGVYFIFKPTVKVDSGIRFFVVNSFEPNESLHDTYAKVTLPPYPCARNIVTRDFAAAPGKSLVFYTSQGCEVTETVEKEKYKCVKEGVDVVCKTTDSITGGCATCYDDAVKVLDEIITKTVKECIKEDKSVVCKTTDSITGGCATCYDDATLKDKISKPSVSEQALTFYEKDPLKNMYAIVNIIEGDKIDPSRIRISVSPEVTYDYTLTLIFEDVNGNLHSFDYIYDYTPNAYPASSVAYDDSGFSSSLGNADLPLVLVGGTISEVKAEEKDSGGRDKYPTSANLEVRFWYENESGTLGYENSVFHFIRNLNFKFASICEQTAEAATLYDPCQQSMQGFITNLNKQVDITGSLYCGTSKTSKDCSVQTTDGKENDLKEFWFVTRRCLNPQCDSVTTTDAYPANINMSDGGGYSRNYTNSGRVGIGTATRYWMRPYNTSSRPFAITGVTLAASEPGTYVIYPFVRYGGNDVTFVSTSDYYPYGESGKPDGRIFVTVNETDELLTCSTLANNGYFKAWWNDCLSRSETQLIAFEHIPGTEEAWIRNRSNHDVDFPFVPEYSYLPQKLEVASLNCKFEALEAGAATGRGWCHHAQIHVPAHTKVTITGGTMYMSGYPEYDEYRVAYMREDTYNISHLFFSIGVDECKTKKIPDTGLSLRSPMTPLKVNAKVEASPDEATSFVFTGNSLRIPAIGLGMETPIPIVHVYYEGNSSDMEWDLSTLGNYVGELEGGTYLPYAGNSVLTGHYWSGGVFKNLEHLNFEDEIIIYANDGFKYTYHVAQKFISEANDVYEMFQQIGDRSLTLVTCENYNLVTNEYERRYIVRAVINSVEPYEEVW